MTSKIPHHLLQDNDGHWYLVAEPHVARFEAAIELDDDGCALSKVKRHEIDGPHRLRIYHWEEA